MHFDHCQGQSSATTKIKKQASFHLWFSVLYFHCELHKCNLGGSQNVRKVKDTFKCLIVHRFAVRNLQAILYFASQQGVSPGIDVLGKAGNMLKP
jgi:hypothetical protein